MKYPFFSYQFSLLGLLGAIFIVASCGPVLAQSTGGCDSYAPNTASGTSQTVSCNSSISPAATEGVTSTANSTS
ncbi:hypothetical protein, partial [Polynucleobacter sp. 39-46-10]|uniref:hypothetical protein n=1 Tax=Polynucleobacter sp. 39-46-10 TaxID=1970428 RepID=UPI0025DB5B98